MTDHQAPEGKLVMPGDILARSEEVLPGDGTFDDGQDIRAVRLGTFAIDPDEFKAVVRPLTSTPVLVEVGDQIVGRIYMVKPAMAGVWVDHVVGKERMVTGDTNGTLHVSKIADRYVEDVGGEYRLGDIIRAKVIQAKPSIQLTTDYEAGGCIKAFCLRCRTGLEHSGQALECPNCGRREVRNLAADYGYGVLALSPDAPPRAPSPQGHRQGGQRGGRRPGGGRGDRGRPDRGGGRGRGGRDGGGGRGRGGGRGGGRGRPRGGGRGGDSQSA